MSSRDAVIDLLGQLTEEQLARLAEFVRSEFPDASRPGVEQDHAAVLDMSIHPALAAIWDNDDDAIFDQL